MTLDSPFSNVGYREVTEMGSILKLVWHVSLRANSLWGVGKASYPLLAPVFL